MRKVRCIKNRVTGQMGRKQHLQRSILAIVKRRPALRLMKIAGAVALTLLIVEVTAGTRSVRGQVETADGGPPNIVLIVADDLGYGSVGAYGQDQISTPHIDRMAEEGMRFTHAYSETICRPSRSVLMTGMHNGHARLRANGRGMHLFPVDVTLAEVLKQSGYVTGAFGKWGLGNFGTPGVPWLQGFDTFTGQLDQVHAHFYYPYWIWQDGRRYSLFENEGEQHARYVQDVIHQHALEFIRAHQEGPFFAYLPYLLPHVELVVPEDSKRPYVDRFPAVVIDDPREGYIDADHGFATYAGMISRLDRYVGEVMALLKNLEIDNRTLVIFTSDNGAQGGAWRQLIEFFDANGGLRGAKGDVYEGGIRVPFIARWPGRIEAGTTSDRSIYFPDMMPTLADVAATSPPPRIDGISFLPTLLGREHHEEKRAMYWAHAGPNGPAQQQALRIGAWKLVKPGSDAPLELYHLESDREESEDLADRYPAMVDRLRKEMDRSWTRRHEFAGGAEARRSDFVR